MDACACRAVCACACTDLFYTQQLMCAQRELSNMGRGSLITMVYAAITDPSPAAGAVGSAGSGGGAVVGGPSVSPRL